MAEVEYSPGFLYLWHLATNEAKAASSARITPDHFVLALCSLGEMSEEALRERPEGIYLQQEAEDVRSVFSAFSLPLSSFRYHLRQRLGQSGENPMDGKWHRSEKAKAVCKCAEEFARECGCDCPEAIHLLWALARQQEGEWCILLCDDGFSLEALEVAAAKRAHAPRKVWE